MEKGVNQKSGFKTILVIICIILFIGLIGKACNSSSNSQNSSGEVRCWYCSKVIYNNDRAIHCSHKYQNSYECDYCGKTNVIK